MMRYKIALAVKMRPDLEAVVTMGRDCAVDVGSIRLVLW